MNTQKFGNIGNFSKMAVGFAKSPLKADSTGYALKCMEQLKISVIISDMARRRAGKK